MAKIETVKLWPMISANRIWMRIALHSVGAIAWIALLLTGVCEAIACAQSPEIICSVSDKELFVGESIVYQVEIKNAENPKQPDLTPLQERFTVTFLGEQSQNQSSTVIINGRISQSNVFSHVYQYRLTPTQAGNTKIPSVSATVDGKTIQSNSISIRVLDIPVQDDVLAEIIPSKSRVYPTQSFSIKLRIWVQPISNMDPMKAIKQLRINPPSIQLSWLKAPEGLSTNEVSEWLQPLMSRNNVGFTINEVSADSGSIFERRRTPVFDLSTGRETKNGLSGKPIDYFVYELERTFVAEKPGTYSFGPAILRGTLESKFIVIAPEVKVQVLEVPTPRPANFIGGIGFYSAVATASPNKLRVGDPMTLTLQINQGRNSGSLELISAPDLTSMPEISEHFEIVDKHPVGRVESNSKKFVFGMRPKQPGVTIPALTLSCFDPNTENFTTISTSPIALSVAEASATLAGGDLVGAIAGNKTANEIKTKSEGIFHNVTDASQVVDERIDLLQGLRWVSWLWIGSGAAIATLFAYRRKNKDTSKQRRVAAKRNAHSKLAAAQSLLTRGNDKEALRELRSAIFGLVADMQNKIAEGLTTSDVKAAAIQVQVPNEEQVRLSQLLEKIESAEYGAIQSGDTMSMLNDARALIDTLSRRLERGASR